MADANNRTNGIIRYVPLWQCDKKKSFPSFRLPLTKWSTTTPGSSIILPLNELIIS